MSKRSSHEDSLRFAATTSHTHAPVTHTTMADFMHGLDPGKLVLSGAVRHPVFPAAMSSRPPGVVRRPQPVRGPGVQPPHLFVRRPRPREQRRRPVAQAGTPPVPRSRPPLTPTSSRASCPRRSSTISSGCSTTTTAFPNSFSSSSGYSRRVHPRPRPRAC
jgi:hypothetical protein